MSRVNPASSSHPTVEPNPGNPKSVDPNEVSVIVDRPAGTVTLEWTDGLIAEFNLVEVRLGCPCATCRVYREQDEDVWPRPGSPLPLAIDAAEMHGAWGLSFTWNDGHATGIYPFETFRRWAELKAGTAG